MPYTVTMIDGVPSNQRRGIGFLESPEDNRPNAKLFFTKLKDKTSRDLRARFDYWLGGGVFDKYFHGWPNDREGKNCFVFKWNQTGTHHRLYGFLCNPKPRTNPAFQVCILISHAQKNTEETDPAELNAVNYLRTRPDVVRAVSVAFPDSER